MLIFRYLALRHLRETRQTGSKPNRQYCNNTFSFLPPFSLPLTATSLQRFLSHNESKIFSKAVEFEKEGKMSEASELFMRQLGNLIISEKNLEMIEKIGEGTTNFMCVCVCAYVCVCVCACVCTSIRPSIHLCMCACVTVCVCACVMIHLCNTTIGEFGLVFHGLLLSSDKNEPPLAVAIKTLKGIEFE